jgi:fatty-acyl-CoA synthase
VDAIPLTTVGKIYKPQLRCDAAQRLVNQIVCGQMGLGDAAIRVREGGRRGMTVNVSLPQAPQAAVEQVQQALSGFLFEVEVVSQPGGAHRA